MESKQEIMQIMKFSGTKDYVATEDLKVAVNAAVTLERPLLIKGEPGTGKTELAKQVAKGLGLEMIEWNIKSTTKAQWPTTEIQWGARGASCRPFCFRK